MVSADGPGDGPPKEDLLAIQTGVGNGRVLITAVGEVDMLTVPRLRDGLYEAIGRKPDTIVVDLGAISYFGSHGLTVLLDAHEDAGRSGSALVIVLGHNHALRRILAITGIDKILTLSPPVEDPFARADDTDRA